MLAREPLGFVPVWLRVGQDGFPRNGADGGRLDALVVAKALKDSQAAAMRPMLLLHTTKLETAAHRNLVSWARALRRGMDGAQACLLPPNAVVRLERTGNSVVVRGMLGDTFSVWGTVRMDSSDTELAHGMSHRGVPTRIGRAVVRAVSAPHPEQPGVLIPHLLTSIPAGRDPMLDTLIAHMPHRKNLLRIITDVDANGRFVIHVDPTGSTYGKPSRGADGREFYGWVKEALPGLMNTEEVQILPTGPLTGSAYENFWVNVKQFAERFETSVAAPPEGRHWHHPDLSALPEVAGEPYLRTDVEDFEPWKHVIPGQTKIRHFTTAHGALARQMGGLDVPHAKEARTRMLGIPGKSLALGVDTADVERLRLPGEATQSDIFTLYFAQDSSGTPLTKLDDQTFTRLDEIGLLKAVHDAGAPRGATFLWMGPAPIGQPLLRLMVLLDHVVNAFDGEAFVAQGQEVQRITDPATQQSHLALVPMAAHTNEPVPTGWVRCVSTGRADTIPRLVNVDLRIYEFVEALGTYRRGSAGSGSYVGAVTHWTANQIDPNQSRVPTGVLRVHLDLWSGRPAIRLRLKGMQQPISHPVSPEETGRWLRSLVPALNNQSSSPYRLVQVIFGDAKGLANQSGSTHRAWAKALSPLLKLPVATNPENTSWFVDAVTNDVRLLTRSSERAQWHFELPAPDHPLPAYGTEPLGRLWLAVAVLALPFPGGVTTYPVETVNGQFGPFINCLQAVGAWVLDLGPQQMSKGVTLHTLKGAQHVAPDVLFNYLKAQGYREGQELVVAVEPQLDEDPARTDRSVLHEQEDRLSTQFSALQRLIKARLHVPDSGFMTRLDRVTGLVESEPLHWAGGQGHRPMETEHLPTDAVFPPGSGWKTLGEGGPMTLWPTAHRALLPARGALIGSPHLVVSLWPGGRPFSWLRLLHYTRSSSSALTMVLDGTNEGELLAADSYGSQPVDQELLIEAVRRARAQATQYIELVTHTSISASAYEALLENVAQLFSDSDLPVYLPPRGSRLDLVDKHDITPFGIQNYLELQAHGDDGSVRDWTPVNLGGRLPRAITGVDGQLIALGKVSTQIHPDPRDGRNGDASAIARWGLVGSSLIGDDAKQVVPMQGPSGLVTVAIKVVNGLPALAFDNNGMERYVPASAQVFDTWLHTELLAGKDITQVRALRLVPLEKVLPQHWDSYHAWARQVADFQTFEIRMDQREIGSHFSAVQRDMVAGLPDRTAAMHHEIEPEWLSLPPGLAEHGTFESHFWTDPARRLIPVTQPYNIGFVFGAVSLYPPVAALKAAPQGVYQMQDNSYAVILRRAEPNSLVPFELATKNGWVPAKPELFVEWLSTSTSYYKDWSWPVVLLPHSVEQSATGEEVTVRPVPIRPEDYPGTTLADWRQRVAELLHAKVYLAHPALYGVIEKPGLLFARPAEAGAGSASEVLANLESWLISSPEDQLSDPGMQAHEDGLLAYPEPLSVPVPNALVTPSDPQLLELVTAVAEASQVTLFAPDWTEDGEPALPVSGKPAPLTAEQWREVLEQTGWDAGEPLQVVSLPRSSTARVAAVQALLKLVEDLPAEFLWPVQEQVELRTGDDGVVQVASVSDDGTTAWISLRSESLPSQVTLLEDGTVRLRGDMTLRVLEDHRLPDNEGEPSLGTEGFVALFAGDLPEIIKEITQRAFDRYDASGTNLTVNILHTLIRGGRILSRFDGGRFGDSNAGYHRLPVEELLEQLALEKGAEWRPLVFMSPFDDPADSPDLTPAQIEANLAKDLRVVTSNWQQPAAAPVEGSAILDRWTRMPAVVGEDGKIGAWHVEHPLGIVTEMLGTGPRGLIWPRHVPFIESYGYGAFSLRMTHAHHGNLFWDHALPTDRKPTDRKVFEHPARPYFWNPIAVATSGEPMLVYTDGPVAVSPAEYLKWARSVGLRSDSDLVVRPIGMTERSRPVFEFWVQQVRAQLPGPGELVLLDPLEPDGFLYDPSTAAITMLDDWAAPVAGYGIVQQPYIVRQPDQGNALSGSGLAARILRTEFKGGRVLGYFDGGRAGEGGYQPIPIVDILDEFRLANDRGFSPLVLRNMAEADGPVPGNLAPTQLEPGLVQDLQSIADHWKQPVASPGQGSSTPLDPWTELPTVESEDGSVGSWMVTYPTDTMDADLLGTGPRGLLWDRNVPFHESYGSGAFSLRLSYAHHGKHVWDRGMRTIRPQMMNALRAKRQYFWNPLALSADGRPMLVHTFGPVAVDARQYLNWLRGLGLRRNTDLIVQPIGLTEHSGPAFEAWLEQLRAQLPDPERLVVVDPLRIEGFIYDPVTVAITLDNSPAPEVGPLDVVRNRRTRLLRWTPGSPHFEEPSQALSGLDSFQLMDPARLRRMAQRPPSTPRPLTSETVRYLPEDEPVPGSPAPRQSDPQSGEQDSAGPNEPSPATPQDYAQLAAEVGGRLRELAESTAGSELSAAWDIYLEYLAFRVEAAAQLIRAMLLGGAQALAAAAEAMTRFGTERIDQARSRLPGRQQPLSVPIQEYYRSELAVGSAPGTSLGDSSAATVPDLMMDALIGRFAAEPGLVDLLNSVRDIGAILYALAEHATETAPRWTADLLRAHSLAYRQHTATMLADAESRQAGPHAVTQAARKLQSQGRERIAAVQAVADDIELLQDFPLDAQPAEEVVEEELLGAATSAESVLLPVNATASAPAETWYPVGDLAPSESQTAVNTSGTKRGWEGPQVDEEQLLTTEPHEGGTGADPSSKRLRLEQAQD
ncbi:hypothetical protein ACWGI8_34075, partial [Streptomyces sp. NPDC054841]